MYTFSIVNEPDAKVTDMCFHPTHHVSPHILHKVLQGLNCHWPMFKMTVWPRNARIELMKIFIYSIYWWSGHLRCMDMMARTHKKKRSTCRRDSPRFLLKNHNETLKMATSMVMQVTTWAQGTTKLSSVSRISLRPGFFYNFQIRKGETMSFRRRQRQRDN